MCIREGGSSYTHLQRHATNMLMCIHSIRVCLFSRSCSLFYTHSPAHTPTHTAILHKFTLPLSSFANHIQKHTHTHTHTHTCAMQAYTQHQTLLLTDSHTLSRRKGKMGWGSTYRDPTHPQNALLVSTRIHTHTHTHTHTQEHTQANMSSHPNEVEQRAQRQRVEAPVGTP